MPYQNMQASFDFPRSTASPVRVEPGCDQIFILLPASRGHHRRSMETRLELVHRDCIEGMARLNEHSVDVVVTSPPYNLGIQYGKYDDRQVREDYLAWS